MHRPDWQIRVNKFSIEPGRVRLKSSLEPTLSLMRTGRLSGTFVWVCPPLDRLPQVHRPGTTDTVRLRGEPQFHSNRAERASILWRTPLTYYIPECQCFTVWELFTRGQGSNTSTLSQSFSRVALEPPGHCFVFHEVVGCDDVVSSISCNTCGARKEKVVEVRRLRLSHRTRVCKNKNL